jgi:hypothetical protein
MSAGVPVAVAVPLAVAAPTVANMPVAVVVDVAEAEPDRTSFYVNFCRNHRDEVIAELQANGVSPSFVNVTKRLAEMFTDLSARR